LDRVVIVEIESKCVMRYCFWGDDALVLSDFSNAVSGCQHVGRRFVPLYDLKILNAEYENTSGGRRRELSDLSITLDRRYITVEYLRRTNGYAPSEVRRDWRMRE